MKAFFLGFCLVLSVFSQPILYDQLTGQTASRGYVAQAVAGTQWLTMMIDDFNVPLGQIWKIQTVHWRGFGLNYGLGTPVPISRWNCSFWTGPANSLNTISAPLNPVYYENFPDQGTLTTNFNLVSNVFLGAGQWWVGCFPTAITTDPFPRAFDLSTDYYVYLVDNITAIGNRFLYADPNCQDFTNCVARGFVSLTFNGTDYKNIAFAVGGTSDSDNPSLSTAADFLITPSTVDYRNGNTIPVTFFGNFLDSNGVKSAVAQLLSADGSTISMNYTYQSSTNNWKANYSFLKGRDALGTWTIVGMTLIDNFNRQTSVTLGQLTTYPHTLLVQDTTTTTGLATTSVTTGFTTAEVTTNQAVTTQGVTTNPVTTASQGSGSLAVTSAPKKKGSAAGAAIGAVFAILIVAAIVAFLVWFFIIRKKKQQKEQAQPASASAQQSQDPLKSNYASMVELVVKNENSSTNPAFTSSRQLHIDPSVEIDIKEVQFGEMIGAGAFGVVYKGKWRNIEVAIKQLRFDTPLSEKEYAAYFDEISLMKKLRNHPNIVMLLGVTSAGHILTEFYEKGSLYGLIQQGEKFNDETIWKIVQGTASGMLHLHTEGIIHRDLAARNILLTKYYDPKISDFGLARTLDRADPSSVGKTQSNVGPLKHLAPEAILSKQYSNKSDVWSFGVVLYEMLARKEPYESLNPVQAAASVAYQGTKLQLPEEVAAKYPAMNEVMNSCFTFDFNVRPDFSVIVARLNA